MYSRACLRPVRGGEPSRASRAVPTESWPCRSSAPSGASWTTSVTRKWRPCFRSPDRNTAVGRRDYALLLNANGLPARQEEALVEIVERGAGCGMAEEREPIWGTKLALPRGPSAGTAPESLKISKRKVPSRVSSQESGPTSMVGRSLPLHDRDPRLVRDLEPPEAAGTQCARRPRPSL